MIKNKIFNYLTLIFAITTIASAFYAVVTDKSTFISTIFLLITLVFVIISNRLNNKQIDLNKEDKELLNIKEEITNKEK